MANYGGIAEAFNANKTTPTTPSPDRLTPEDIAWYDAHPTEVAPKQGEPMTSLANVKVGMIIPELGPAPLTAGEVMYLSKLPPIPMSSVSYIKGKRAEAAKPLAEVPPNQGLPPVAPTVRASVTPGVGYNVRSDAQNTIDEAMDKIKVAISVDPNLTNTNFTPGAQIAAGGGGVPIGSTGKGEGAFGTQPGEEQILQKQDALTVASGAGGTGGVGDIDTKIKDLIDKLSATPKELQEAATKRIRDAYAQNLAATLDLVTAARSRYSPSAGGLRTSGYGGALSRAALMSKTAEEGAITDIEKYYSGLGQEGEGTALSALMSLRGQNIQKLAGETDDAYRNRVLAMQEAEAKASGERWQKEFGLSKDQFEYNKTLPGIQRKWALEDWNKESELAKYLAGQAKPTAWDWFLKTLGTGANAYAAITNPAGYVAGKAVTG